MTNHKLQIIKSKKGFTLIELLVVVSILGILLALSIFGAQGARQSSRDAKRKTDLEQIRSGLEMYKADCNSYPVNIKSGETLVGSGATSACLESNMYINKIPTDPLSTTNSYAYKQIDSSTYVLCASLEQTPSPPMVTSNCSSCINACNYIVTNP
jgi:type IV pilus assembly protein PilA